MSTEGAEVDEAETMASTGDESGSFREIASGTATGLGIDRGEAGTGGFDTDEDLEAVAEGDWSRRWYRSEPFSPPEKSADRYALSEHAHHRFGWEIGADLDEDDLEFFEDNEPEEG